MNFEGKWYAVKYINKYTGSGKWPIWPPFLFGGICYLAFSNWSLFPVAGQAQLGGQGKCSVQLLQVHALLLKDLISLSSFRYIRLLWLTLFKAVVGRLSCDWQPLTSQVELPVGWYSICDSFPMCLCAIEFRSQILSWKLFYWGWKIFDPSLSDQLRFIPPIILHG